MLREQTGTSGVERTVRDAVAVLAHWDIPHLIAGGLAVQEHGYFRVTLNVDIIVPDVMQAVEMITADMSGPFQRVSGIPDTVRDTRTDVIVHFLPAQQSFGTRSKVPFPLPIEVADTPRFVTLPQLIALKLDSWQSAPNRRLKDKSDVIELIKALRLPRDLALDPRMAALYTETWDALQAEL